MSDMRIVYLWTHKYGHDIYASRSKLEAAIRDYCGDEDAAFDDGRTIDDFLRTLADDGVAYDYSVDIYVDAYGVDADEMERVAGTTFKEVVPRPAREMRIAE